MSNATDTSRPASQPPPVKIIREVKLLTVGYPNDDHCYVCFITPATESRPSECFQFNLRNKRQVSHLRYSAQKAEDRWP